MDTAQSRGRSCAETGQAMVLFVFALVAVLGFTAMVVDVGQGYVDKRGAQNAADAAALAAVAYLPGDSATAIAKSTQYLQANGYDPSDARNTVTITTPYQGNPNKIEVRITHNLDATFGRVLGIDNFNVHARAVAERTQNNYALFQTGPNPSGDDDDDHPDCDGELELEGDNLFVDGDAHADGEFEIEADNSGPGSGNANIEITGAVTYVCEFEVEGSSVAFGSGPTQLPGPVPPPVAFDYSAFPCTFSVVGDLKIERDTPQYFVNNNPNSGQLRPGVYCATGDIKLDNDVPAAQVSGNVTFVAHEEIELEHDNLSLTAFDSSGVLAFTDGCEDGDDDDGDAGENPGDGGDDDGDGGEGEIELEADNITFSGMLIAACGEIELEGDFITSPSTLIVGQEIEIEGSGISLTAANLTLGGPRLVE